MQFVRPTIARPAATVSPAPRQAFVPGLSGLGDDLAAGTAQTLLVQYLRDWVIVAGGPTAVGTVTTSSPLGSVIATAKRIIVSGNARQLPADQQTAFNAWKVRTSDPNAEASIGAALARMVEVWGDQLVAALSVQAQNGMISDPVASKAVFTLMDTTQQGTTWYGGTVTTSKLSSAQWNGLFLNAFNVIAKGVSQSVLPFSYLAALCKAMLAPLTSRRFPVWHCPPGSVPLSDPRNIAFRTMLKQLGWSSVVQLWFTYTQQAWAEQNARSEAQDAQLGAAITALNFMSGKVIIDQIAAKVRDYFSARQEAVDSLRELERLKKGPLAQYIPATRLAEQEKIKKQFVDVDMSTFQALSPAGLWPSGTTAGMAGVQIVVAGVVAVTILGLIVWAIGLMTSVSRQAAAQAKATVDEILDTARRLKESCVREYDSSNKSPEAEAKLQACLLKTEALTEQAAAVKPPMNPVTMALLGVLGIGGFIAYKKLS